MLRVINEIRPTWVIGENVAGIGTMVEQCRITDMGSQASLFEEGGGVYRYAAEYTFTIERICSDLESIGYSIQPMLVPACAVGAPHRRDRIFFIAHNDIASDTINKGSLRDSGTNATKEGKERISERNKVQWSHEPADARSSIQLSSSDTYLQRCHKSKFAEEPRKEKRFLSEENIEGRFRSLHPKERWSSFPTVTAVHRGNDGIPFDVDKLSIPIGRWRTESIKAYGNAIVPQVMYRIFEAIEAISI